MKKLLLLCLLFCSKPIFSQNEDSLLRFSAEQLLDLKPETAWQQVQISTASLSQEGIGSAPAMIRVVSEEQIALRAYRSLLDVLRDMPDIKIDYDDTQGYANFRGMVKNNRFVVLLDGVRISSPTNENILIFENYPIHFAKQIEIVYGASSSLYGADALAGIINIISKDRGKNKVSAELDLQRGNYGLYNASLWYAQRLGTDLSLSVAGSFFDDQQAPLDRYYNLDMSSHQTGVFNTIFGAVKSPKPVQAAYQTPVRAYSLWAKLNTKDFSVSLLHNSGRYSNSTSNTPQNAVYNADVFYEQSVSVAHAKYAKAFKKILFNTLLMGSIYEVNPLSNFRNAFTGMDYGYKYAYGSLLKFQQDISWQLNQKWLFVGGFTGESFYAVPKSADLEVPVNPSRGLSGNYFGTDIATQFFQVKYANWGAFAQMRYHSEKFSLTVGSRWDYNTRFGATFNPRLALNYHPKEQSFVKILFSSAFLAPSPLESFEHYGSFYRKDDGSYASFFWHLPNPYLKPMISRNLELNFRQNIYKNWGIELNIYHNWVSNLTILAPDATTLNLYGGRFLGYPVDYIEMTINQGKERIYGGTIQSDWHYRSAQHKLDCYAALSLIDGVSEEQINKQDVEVQAPMLTPFQLKVGLDWQWRKFSFSPRWIWAGRQILKNFETESLNRQQIEGFHLLNFAFRYLFYKESALFLRVQNALDRRYFLGAEALDANNAYYIRQGIPQQPLRWQLGLQLKL